MPRTIALGKIEQALVDEVSSAYSAAVAQLQAQADAKLACVLEAHGVLGQRCQFIKTASGWDLVAPDEAPAADVPPVNDF